MINATSTAPVEVLKIQKIPAAPIVMTPVRDVSIPLNTVSHAPLITLELSDHQPVLKIVKMDTMVIRIRIPVRLVQ